MMAAVEAVFTMTPSPRSTIWGSTARHMKKVPLRLTPTILVNCPGSTSWLLAKPPMPATLQSTSIWPSASVAAATVASTADQSLTSHVSAVADAPMPSAVAPTLSAMRSTHATRAPSAASRSATARPMPDPAPVTSALLPAYRCSMLLLGRWPTGRDAPWTGRLVGGGVRPGASVEGQDAAGDAAALHVVHRVVEALERVGVGDQLVEHELAATVEVHDLGHVHVGAVGAGPHADHTALVLGEV